MACTGMKKLAHSPAHSLSTHAPLSVCLPLSIYLHLSLWTPGVLLGFHPCSILFSAGTKFTHSSTGSGTASRAHTHVDSARETSVCARCGFLCSSDETDQQLRAIRTLFIKLQTPSLLDYFCQERFVQTCCEISADVVVICLFT